MQAEILSAFFISSEESLKQCEKKSVAPPEPWGN
jgi:hypothetical protein